MKIKHPSTLHEPLQFFKWFYNDKSIEAFKDWFYDDVPSDNEQIDKYCRESRINPSLKANRNEGYIEYLDPNSNYIEVQESVEEGLYKFISIQSRYSIYLISKRVNKQLKNSKEYIKLLEFYLKELTYIELDTEKLISTYSVLQSPLIDIENYIKKRYLRLPTRVYTAFGQNEDELKISEIFSYLNGLNDEGGKIMSNDDYKRLISFVTSYLEVEGIPEFGERIPDLNGLDKLTLHRTFHTFWKTFKGLKNNRPDMALLLIAAFEQFKSSNPKAITKGLTNKPNYWKKCVPSIIKE